MASLPRFLPILWIMVPILYLYKVTYEAADLLSLAIITLIIIILYISITIFLNYFDIDKNKLSVYWSVGIIWMFAYNASRVTFYRLSNSYLYENKYFIFIWIAVFMAGFALIRNIGNGTVIIARNILATAAIFMITANLIGLGAAIVYNNRKSKVDGSSNQIIPPFVYNKDSLPNIYYIVFDEYPGSKELKKYFNYDNSEFEDMLRSRGFYITNDSYCNYCFTFFSDATSLNMEYLTDSNNLIEKLINNKIRKYFSNMGYNFVMLQKTRLNDFLYDNSPFNNFLFDLVNMTFLGKPLGENCLRGDSKRKMILEQFKTLGNLVNPLEPTIVYAHIMIPHRPYLFDQNGGHLPYWARFFQYPANEKLFLNQLMFTNEMIKKIVDKLINESKIPPIIILQGDHGPRPFYNYKKERLKLRMSILNAYLLPRGVRQNLYDSITPVNSFRLILNKCFGVNLDLLRDENYFAISEENELINVTNEIRSPSTK